MKHQKRDKHNKYFSVHIDYLREKEQRSALLKAEEFITYFYALASTNGCKRATPWRVIPNAVKYLCCVCIDFSTTCSK